MVHKRSTWMVVMLLLLTVSISPLQAAADEKAAKEEKVAVVNGVGIAKDDFDREMRRVEQQIAMSGETPDSNALSEAKNQVLEGLINRELLYQESQKTGIKVQESEVDERTAMLKQRFPSEDEFKNALSKMSITEQELKSQFAREMAIKGLIDQQITDKVTVSEKEIESFYNSNPSYFKMPEQVRASHILVKVDPKATEQEKAKAREKIAGLQKRVQKGEDFAAIAKENSDCPSAARGGDLDYFERGQMVGPFEDAAFALKPGEVSDIVETQFGYHLIKAVDRKEAGVVPLAEAEDKIEQHLKQEKVNQQLVQYVAQLKDKAKIERNIQ